MVINLFIFCLLCVSCLKNYVVCDDIFGCGGFVKSSFLINYSRVEIKLYTKPGSLKYQTDCAPNNGYYLIPLYDKGDYILKIEPPLGWSFEPSSFALHVDGTSDPCSLNQDINFVFKGFTVQGQILSHGLASGPAGINLALKTSDGKIFETSSSDEKGYYTFAPLLPGKYVIEANHPLWLFDKSSEAIEVIQDNVKTENQIIVAGYDVRGNVYSEGEPIQGVSFLLFTKRSMKTPTGCNDSPVKSFKQKLQMTYICHVTSLHDGSFLFPSLPPADYKLVPFYKGEHIEFDVTPAEKDFTVDEKSLQFSESFQVQGFSVSGTVSSGPNGRKLGGAEVYLNGNSHTTSDSNGVYHLENMRAGTYQIEIKLPHIFFDVVTIKVTPNTPRLPEIVATRFSVCGKLIIDEYPEGLEDYKKNIAMKNLKDDKMTHIFIEADGNFCTESPPGRYELKPALSEMAASSGLLLIPGSHVIEVTDQPLTNVMFKQFRTNVQGKVKCIESCEGLVLDLSALSHDRPHMKTASSSEGYFEFKNCLPGNYLLTVIKDDWCFQSKAIRFTIDSKTTKMDLEFHQSGFQAAIVLTHASTFKVKYPSGEFHNVELQRLKNVLCLPEHGIYEFVPVGCHLYQKDSFKFDTHLPFEIELSPTKHLVTGTILTELNVTDIKILVKKQTGDNVISLQEPLDMKGNYFRYTFSVFVLPHTELDIRATSKQVLFHPPLISVTVLDDCMENAVEIIGKKGVFIRGSITPPLEDVKMQVFLKNSDSLFNEVLTDQTGQFVIGPVEDENDYSINAEKEGYIFTELSELGKFMAFKLAEIVVTVENEDKQPLSGVLLSLSGGTDYRKNSKTQKNGKLSFFGLGPGQYYLKPIMKEYRFEPSTKMIDIKEGTQVNIKISGQRVAYSLYGVVSSLTGEAEVGVAVEAVGTPVSQCKQYQEEAISEQGGTFRIRGLQPDCRYILRLKSGVEVNQHIERSTPREIPIEVKKGDITGVRLIVFRYYGQMDVSGNVVTNQEYLPTLKVRLYREDTPDQVVNSVNLGQSSFFFLPSMPIDKKTYFLRLESSLPSSGYFLEQPTVTFCANTSFYHFSVPFHPKVKTVDQEVTQGSILAFPIAVMAFLIAYNYKKLLPLFNQLLQYAMSFLTPGRIQMVGGESVTFSDNSNRRKSKPKRIQ